MAAFKTFREIEAYKDAYCLAYEIYKNINTNRDYAFKDQIRRASLSISNNIAEGFGRNSDADFRRFLFYSVGSCMEVLNMLLLAKDLGYVSSQQAKQLIMLTESITKKLRGLIKYLSKNRDQRPRTND
ncbi:MAG: four helix bundle protein [Bacteroidetes bacterium]|nr:four helix bundle protein [Bacteroidota bacterium]MBT4409240.1 four helix bundle protein [Bacteroidota bacterium]MBT7712190.1 four helix bundle protein [Deltaproteobacteria bacterium]